MMQENTFLLNRTRTFEKFRYIFVVTTEKSDEELLSWEGRLHYLKTHITEIYKDQEKRMSELERHIALTLDQHHREAEVRSEKQTADLKWRLEQLEKSIRQNSQRRRFKGDSLSVAAEEDM